MTHHRNLHSGLIGALASLLLAAPSANAYVYCLTKVTDIQPHKTNGIVYFKFANGSVIHAENNDAGMERNFAVALAALMADRPVKIALNDGQQCGWNNQEHWTYIIAIDQ